MSKVSLNPDYGIMVTGSKSQLLYGLIPKQSRDHNNLLPAGNVI